MDGAEVEPCDFSAAKPDCLTSGRKDEWRCHTDAGVPFEEFNEHLKGIFRYSRIRIDEPDIFGSLVKSETDADIGAPSEADIVGVADIVGARVVFLGDFERLIGRVVVDNHDSKQRIFQSKNRPETSRKRLFSVVVHNDDEDERVTVHTEEVIIFSEFSDFREKRRKISSFLTDPVSESAIR